MTKINFLFSWLLDHVRECQFMPPGKTLPIESFIEQASGE